MPACTAAPVVLTAAERHRLKKTAYSHKTPHQARKRATIVPPAARGRSNAPTAVQTRLHVDTVRTRRGRFATGGLPALPHPRRSGRPPSLTPLQVAEVKALNCQLPAESGTPLTRWSYPELALVLLTAAVPAVLALPAPAGAGKPARLDGAASPTAVTRATAFAAVLTFAATLTAAHAQLT
ncbi:helix-turn-helix domain-containing protein [Streptomyces sp. NPDC001315]|uniref:helix-turn-helix domain-containing protein n=1 Tax=Streptomyces sp. NPDC001315 TaxID=3364562 RepID=UPI003677435D